MRTFAEWLRDHRTRPPRAWTQRDLARRMRVDTSTVSRWERGRGEPSVGEFHDLCLLFGVSVLFAASADVVLGTGGGEIRFGGDDKRAAKEPCDGDEEKRITPEDDPAGDGEAPVRGEVDRRGIGKARRRNGRLRGGGRGPEGVAFGVGAASEDAREAS
jgi:transcriptional regulator with XRE-family HTH domain